MPTGRADRNDTIKRWQVLAERFQALADRPVHAIPDPSYGPLRDGIGYAPCPSVPSRSTEHDDGYRLMAEMCRLMTVTRAGAANAAGLMARREGEMGDVLDDLKAWAACSTGGPVPEGANTINGWGPALSDVLNRAIAEIAHLERKLNAAVPAMEKARGLSEADRVRLAQITRDLAEYADEIEIELVPLGIEPSVDDEVAKGGGWSLAGRTGARHWSRRKVKKPGGGV